MTYAEAIRQIKHTLKQIGLADGEIASETGLIVRCACNKSMGYAVANGNAELEQAQADAIMKILERRIAREPLQYIIGSTGFADITVKCDGRALIPRHDTEILYNCVLDSIEAGAQPRILDLCTGSGCLALAVKSAVDCEMYASDISEDALALAAENADLLRLDVNFIHADLFDGIDERFDIICSNPPYIATSVIDGLEVEVKDFEPRMALDGGTDGLDFYRRIASDARRCLNVGGLIALEIGFDQGKSVAELFQDCDVRVIKDYSDNDRVVLARLRR